MHDPAMTQPAPPLFQDRNQSRDREGATSQRGEATSLLDSTKRLAADASAKISGQRRRQIIEQLRDRGPLAIWEIAQYLGLQQHQISGRFGELERDGLIEKTGDRRPHPVSRCPAEVYRLGAPIRAVPARRDRERP